MRNTIHHIGQRFASNGLATKANYSSNTTHTYQELGRIAMPRDANQSRTAVFRLNNA